MRSKKMSKRMLRGGSDAGEVEVEEMPAKGFYRKKRDFCETIASLNPKLNPDELSNKIYNTIFETAKGLIQSKVAEDLEGIRRQQVENQLIEYIKSDACESRLNDEDKVKLQNMLELFKEKVDVNIEEMSSEILELNKSLTKFRQAEQDAKSVAYKEENKQQIIEIKKKMEKITQKLQELKSTSGAFKDLAVLNEELSKDKIFEALKQSMKGDLTFNYSIKQDAVNLNFNDLNSPLDYNHDNKVEVVNNKTCNLSQFSTNPNLFCTEVKQVIKFTFTLNTQQSLTQFNKLFTSDHYQDKLLIIPFDDNDNSLTDNNRHILRFSNNPIFKKDFLKASLQGTDYKNALTKDTFTNDSLVEKGTYPITSINTFVKTFNTKSQELNKHLFILFEYNNTERVYHYYLFGHYLSEQITFQKYQQNLERESLRLDEQLRLHLAVEQTLDDDDALKVVLEERTSELEASIKKEKEDRERLNKERIEAINQKFRIIDIEETRKQQIMELTYKTKMNEELRAIQIKIDKDVKNDAELRKTNYKEKMDGLLKEYETFLKSIEDMTFEKNTLIEKGRYLIEKKKEDIELQKKIIEKEQELKEKQLEIQKASEGKLNEEKAKVEIETKKINVKIEALDAEVSVAEVEFEQLQTTLTDSLKDMEKTSDEIKTLYKDTAINAENLESRMTELQAQIEAQKVIYKEALTNLKTHIESNTQELQESTDEELKGVTGVTAGGARKGKSRKYTRKQSKKRKNKKINRKRTKNRKTSSKKRKKLIF